MVGVDSDRRLNELFQQLANFERTRTGAAAWSLDNMHQLLADTPPGSSASRWVQVAGSKGKGTTVAYLEELARSMGLRTGAFVSPHLEHVTERVRIDGVPVAAPILVTAMEHVLASAQARQLELSFFEAITAAAVRVFRETEVEFVALEVGLGGRLDATTAVPVDAVVLTRIELEHTEILGDTLAAIATEKAHAMRPGKPVFLERNASVRDVFLTHAEAVGAGPVHWIEPVEVSHHSGGWSGAFVVQSAGEAQADTAAGASRRDSFRLQGASRFELPALGLAAACLRSLFPHRPPVLDPARRPAQPGRFEVVESGGQTTILDGAHTPASAAEVVAELDRRYAGRSVVMLFASAQDKNWRDALEILVPRVDAVVVTEAAGTPSAPAVDLATWLRRAGVEVQVAPDPETGWRRAAGWSGREPALRLVTGSFYLVGAVRGLLRR